MSQLFGMQDCAGPVEVRLPVSGPTRAVVVICPGQNGDSRGELRDERWTRFADEAGIALAGVAFQSPDELLARGGGYFDAAASGSGAALLGALEEQDLGKLPLYLIGFSGGAHFVMSFAAWRPERVGGFCVQGFSWAGVPPPSLQSPALVACGDRDGIRYGQGYSYFQAGRRNGAPWVWLSLKGVAHEPCGDLEEFFRQWVRQLVKGCREDLLADNATHGIIKGKPCAITSSVLPCSGLLKPWQAVHRP